MAELGAHLKEARMAKGYSLDDLQEITKIQKRYLSAIEDGNYSVMPGTFYVRAFIKQYAEAVGLDANEVLETYKSEIPVNKVAGNTPQNVPVQKQQPTTRRQKQQTQRTASSNGQTKKFGDVMPKAVVALFIIVLVVAIAFLMINRSSNDVVDQVKEDNTEVTSNNEDKVVSEEEKKAEEEAAAKKAEEEAAAKKKAKEEKKAKEQGTLSEGTVETDGATTTYALSDTDNFKIRVEVSGDNWIGVTDENGSEIANAAKMFASGDKIEVDAKGKQSVRVRLGAAGNAKVYVNDKEVAFAVPANERPTQNIVIKVAEEN